MEGRIFIRSVFLILTAYFKGVIEKNGWTRNYNFQKIFSEMKSLKQVEAKEKRKKWQPPLQLFSKKIWNYINSLLVLCMRWEVDLRKHTIEEAWNSEKFENFYKHLSVACLNCENRSACMGGCPIRQEIVLCRKKALYYQVTENLSGNGGTDVVHKLYGK